MGTQKMAPGSLRALGPSKPPCQSAKHMVSKAKGLEGTVLSPTMGGTALRCSAFLIHTRGLLRAEEASQENGLVGLSGYQQPSKFRVHGARHLVWLPASPRSTWAHSLLRQGASSL